MRFRHQRIGGGVTVGFWSSMNNASQVNDNTGFYGTGGSFHSVTFPTTDNATPPVNQLLGVNDSGIAVGFYTNGQGSNRGMSTTSSPGNSPGCLCRGRRRARPGRA